MKISTIFSLATVAVALPISFYVSLPYFRELESVQKDCVQTKPEARNDSQRSNCKTKAPYGFIIPGVL